MRFRSEAHGGAGAPEGDATSIAIASYSETPAAVKQLLRVLRLVRRDVWLAFGAMGGLHGNGVAPS